MIKAGLNSTSGRSLQDTGSGLHAALQTMRSVLFKNPLDIYSIGLGHLEEKIKSCFFLSLKPRFSTTFSVFHNLSLKERSIFYHQEEKNPL